MSRSGKLLLPILAAVCAAGAQRLSIAEILSRMRSGGSGRIVFDDDRQHFAPVQPRDSLVFVVDDSASIGHHYSKMRGVINEMVRGESEPGGSVRMAMGVVKFGTGAETVLWPTVDARAITDTVNRMPHGRQGRTNIVDGLERAGDMLRSSTGYGSDVIVLLTDGHHNANGRDPVDTADALKRRPRLCIIVCEIGIDTDAEKLDALSGCHAYRHPPWPMPHGRPAPGCPTCDSGPSGGGSGAGAKPAKAQCAAGGLVVKTSFAELGSNMAGVVSQLKDKVKQSQDC